MKTNYIHNNIINNTPFAYIHTILTLIRLFHRSQVDNLNNCKLRETIHRRMAAYRSLDFITTITDLTAPVFMLATTCEAKKLNLKICWQMYANVEL